MVRCVILFLSTHFGSRNLYSKLAFMLCQDNFKVVRNVSFVHTNSPDDDFRKVEKQKRAQNAREYKKKTQEALAELIILSLFIFIEE